MKIWVDGKNLALYNSGISHWTELITSGIGNYENYEFTFVYPKSNNKSQSPRQNISTLELPWLGFLPTKLSHLIYDNFTFRFYAKIKKPDLIFSPYYDVVLPKKIKGIISIHDLCFLEAKKSYSFLRRSYFTKIMRMNLKRSKLIVTVSQNTRNQLIEIMKVSPDKIRVIPMTLSYEFRNYSPSGAEMISFREKYGHESELILYTSGLENRKNVPSMLYVIDRIMKKRTNVKLVITGRDNQAWKSLIAKYPNLKRNTFFTGFLSTAQLKTAYCSADLVVFPSLSEGYGNACVESMDAKVPLICSDIPIFHEIAGDYASYFNPLDHDSMERIILRGLDEKESTEYVSDFLGEEQLANLFFELIKEFDNA